MKKNSFLFLLMTAMLSMTSVSMMANGEDVQLTVGIIDPFGRICNPTAVSISICNAIRANTKELWLQ